MREATYRKIRVTLDLFGVAIGICLLALLLSFLFGFC